MFWIFKKPPPEPKVPRWVVQMVTPLILTVFMALMAFIGNGFSEELKGKANNDTVIMYMQKQKETDDRQWEAIKQSFEKQNRNQKETSDKIERKIQELQRQILTQQQMILEIIKEKEATTK